MDTTDQNTPVATVSDVPVETITAPTPATVVTPEPVTVTEIATSEPALVLTQPIQQESITPEKPVEVIPTKRVIVTGKPPVNSSGKSVF